MGKILVVSPSFPPDKTVAVVRMESFVEFLLSKKEEVIVVTNKKSECNIQYVKFRVEYVDIIEDDGYNSFSRNAEKYNSKIAEILDADQIDYMVVSMGPFYTYEIAALAKRKNVRCLLDFRDPWSFDKREENMLDQVKRLIKFPVKYVKECIAVNNSDCVTTVTPGWLKKFKKYHPIQKRKFFLVENGYDDRKLSNIAMPESKSTADNRLLIGVFGKMFYYSEKYSDIFLRAVKEVSDVDLLIKQVGCLEETAIKKLASHKLEKNIIMSTGFVDYISGVCLLKDCDALLIIDDRKEALGTKLYDYIFLKKPIIYVGPRKSAIAAIIKDLDNCFICNTTEQIIDALRFLDIHRGLEINCDRDFSRTSQNVILYKLLKS